MDTSVRDLLKERERRSGGRRIVSGLVSLLVHGAALGTVLLAPALAARESRPIEYTRVQIVPLKALGVPDPAPARSPEPAPPPRPEPEPVPPREEPEPAPPREERRLAPGDRQDRNRPPETARSPATPPRDDEGGGSDQIGQRRGAPDGSPLGLAPFGSSQSGFDDPNFRFPYYRDMLLATIGSHYRRPPISAEVELILHFRIARDGTIFGLEIVQPSGYASFDQAGLSAVRSSTLPHLPVSYPHDSLGVSLIIR